MALRISSLFHVAGKSVLVTGGGRGIGRMLAEGFMENGCKVYIAARDKAALDETAEQLNALATAGQCVALQSNLGSRSGCEELASTVEELEPNGLQVLVNNSGTSWGEPLSRKSGRMNWGWDKVLDLNLKAPFYLTRALLPSLRRGAAPEDPGRVIMIGSVVGVTPQEVPTHAYDASKAALHSLTRKLAFELAEEAPVSEEGSSPVGRVTVNCLAPGYIPTKMTEGLATWGSDEASTSEAIPLGRMGTGSDLAGAVLYLSSPAGRWVTGAIIPVDGGILAQPISLGAKV
jgi:NAD(P)-dependent dehydrogenase (short-subunit alcohol dehydrogenase family)